MSPLPRTSTARRTGRVPYSARRLRTRVFSAGFVVLISAIPAVNEGSSLRHDHLVNSASYKTSHGFWERVDIPVDFRINAVHATLLRTGQILLVAGSGNDQAAFDAGTFKSLLFDPATRTFTKIPTPVDLFCAGHIQLPDGNLLIAGGTKRYENLTPTHAGGAMTLTNESPNGPHTFTKGTILVGPSGARYRIAFTTVVPAATKSVNATTHVVTVTHSQANVWVDAVAAGRGSVLKTAAQYQVEGLTGADARNLYGIGSPITLQQQDFQGLNDAYIYDVSAERYVKVDSMKYARWYPTLTEMGNGMIMTTSGLNDVGQIVEGDNEIFDPATDTWSTGPRHKFPTYPSIFQTTIPNTLFFTGSSSGYGPNLPSWRTPGLWNVLTDTFTPITGIKDPKELETSASVLLAPAQNQRYMVVGGGGVGASKKATARTSIIDLLSGRPSWTPGPNLPHETRYPIVVTLPDDTELVTGGSGDYRGNHRSDNRDAEIYNPSTNAFTTAADSITGRDYHSGGLLTPEGYVVTFGGNPLFSDEKDTITAPFNQEIDVYYPTYFYTGRARPQITAAPTTMQRGSTYTITVPDAAKISKLRLMRPSSVTHVTDVNQRSVAVAFTRTGPDTLRITIPRFGNLLPPGYYMLFADNAAGLPSTGHMVDVPAPGSVSPATVSDAGMGDMAMGGDSDMSGMG